jgi:hypothetical protein
MDSTAQIKERPILFSAPMVRAILDGRKTMTLRLMVDVEAFLAGDDETVAGCFCPYGQPGDRLWVRETFMIHGGEIAFAATDQPLVGCDKWKPSIFMPRLASRITLEVVAVRVERLQDITEHDAELEGAAMREHFEKAKHGHPLQPHKTAFAWLWNKINGRDSWAANPWVWVVEFARLLEAPSHG